MAYIFSLRSKLFLHHKLLLALRSKLFTHHKLLLVLRVSDNLHDSPPCHIPAPLISGAVNSLSACSNAIQTALKTRIVFYKKKSVLEMRQTNSLGFMTNTLRMVVLWNQLRDLE